MRKKIIIVAVVVILIISFSLCISNSSHKVVEEDTMELPDISSITVEGDLFELSKLEKVKTTIVFFFSPECDHCEEELKGILEKKAFTESSDYRWIFITMDILKEELEIFLKSVPVNEMSNAFILLDKGLNYHLLFDVVGSPYVFVFNESERLTHKIIGGFEIDTLIQWL